MNYNRIRARSKIVRKGAVLNQKTTPDNAILTEDEVNYLLTEDEQFYLIPE
jgi:hypothetical protein